MWDKVILKERKIMTLKLVKGEFSSLEEALRAQVVMMQERIEKLEKQQEYCYHCGRHWEECCHE